MKAILALSSALLFVLGLLGSVVSAQTLATTFDDGDEGWGSQEGGSLTWQRFGGDPGGFLQAEVTGGGVWSCESPPAWSGDWSRYVGGILSFDERLIAADGSVPGEGHVKILVSDGTVLSWCIPAPERFWTSRK
ncbi:MAG TPA: hypothetical protein HA349_02005, partial [Methanotrichaceae archaeon]|nr:hypothetical protein [Methanotrichaceae archaeon]